jgi:hypothetical protein
MKQNDRSVTVQALGLAAIAFGLYASLLSKAYVFEGLLRAMPIETGRWQHLFAANYLLYGPLGLLFHALLRFLGFLQPAVVSLQVMDALIGAAGIGVFYTLLRRLGGDPLSSVSWAGALACSLGYWLWSTDAENYILSSFLLLINFFAIVKYVQGEWKDPLILGALHALAILGHIVNAAFGAVILWVIYSVHRGQGLKPALRYAGTAALLTLSVYAAVIVFVLKPEHVHETLRWLAGSAGASADGTVTFGGGFGLKKTWDWLKMTLHIWVSFSPAYTAPSAWPASGALLKAAAFLVAVFGAVLAVRGKEIYRRSPAIVGACGIWLAVYACVFLRWQPWTMVYRVSDLIPLSVLLFLACQSLSRNTLVWRGAAAALALCLLGGNLGAELYPRSFASNNPHLSRMAFVKANTAEGDWVTGDSGQDEIYIPYFAERRPIVVERFAHRPEQLSGLLKQLVEQKQTVWVTSRVLEAPFWKTFFSRSSFEMKARDAHGFTLYRIRSYHDGHE